MRYYLKESVTSSPPILDRHGRPIHFDILGGDYGGRELDETKDAELISDLDGFISQRIGGVIRSSEEELKKNATKPFYKLSGSTSEMLQIAPSTNDRPKPGGVAAVEPAKVVVQEQAPMQPSPIVPVAPVGFKPRRGRASVVQPVLVKPMLPAESV